MPHGGCNGAILPAWFVYRQLHEAHPIYDLRVASRRTFWVAACSGTIVFGALMGAMFLGQQFIQVVLGYSTIDASRAILPSPLCTLLVAGYSAHLVRKFGSRLTLLATWEAPSCSRSLGRCWQAVGVNTKIINALEMSISEAQTVAAQR